MEFKKQLQSYKREIDQALARFFVTKIREAKKWGVEPEKFIKILAEYTNRPGAKRIRGALVRVGYELAGGKEERVILDLSLSLELFQSFILIHDDFIDRDELRRGLPTVHNIFSAVYKKRFKQQAVHYGASFAILLGDTAYVLSHQLIAASKFSDKVKNRVFETINLNLEKVMYGELLDVYGCETEKEIKFMNELKTSLYSFINPLLIGAICGGGGQALLRRLEQYGRDLGIAFQIQDDIIGLLGEEKVTGKPVGSDVREKRNTLLIFETRKRLLGKDKQIFDKIWRKSVVTQADIRQIQQLVANSGSLEYNQKIAQNLVKQAKKSLMQLADADGASRRFLLTLADYVITRDR